MAYFKNLILGFLLCCTLTAQAQHIQVAAASNLRYVLPVLIHQFEQQTGHQVSAMYAASGTITTQIQHGAPYDIFLSANPDYIARLSAEKLTYGSAIDMAQAQLALYARNDSVLVLDDDLLNLKVLIDSGKLKKVAIANPIHAPYGQAAKQVLQHAGIWQQIQPHLLTAENATQAVQFSLSSSVDVGFVPYGHVIQDQLSKRGYFIKLAPRLPQQAAALNDSPVTLQFLQFIQTKQAQQLFEQYGFATTQEQK